MQTLPLCEVTGRGLDANQVPDRVKISLSHVYSVHYIIFSSVYHHLLLEKKNIVF